MTFANSFFGNPSRFSGLVSLFACVLTMTVSSVAQESADSKPSEPAEKVKLPVMGFSDTPLIPNQPWKIHDLYRPHPRAVEANAYGAASSDAIVLFDGKDLGLWGHVGTNAAELIAPRWKVTDGYFEVEPTTGDLQTLETFGSCQLHIEWSVPENDAKIGQEKGDSGVLFMGQYEIQIHDSYKTRTYADGQAGALYGVFPPLVNASRAPGQWQSFDIVFEAPVFENDQVIRKANATVFHNGVLIHHHREFIGPTKHRELPSYKSAPPAGPLVLQNHESPVRFRNVWLRNL